MSTEGEDTKVIKTFLVVVAVIFFCAMIAESVTRWSEVEIEREKAQQIQVDKQQKVDGK